MKKQDYLERILNARVYDVAVETPLELAPNLTRRLGNRLWLKREDMQSVFSFKVRGAYNKMARLPAQKLKRGVITASAGNHAQGVALAARQLACAATIVMPVTTPQIKVDAVRERGAKVVLHGDTYDEAHEHARRLERKGGLTFVHPYDDPDVIAGQGTIGLEILRQHTAALHAIFVPIGGGGLMSGIASYVKRLRPEIRMIGVEPVDSDAMHRSLEAGRRVKLDQVGLFADGVAVKQVGIETFRLCRELVDEVVRVDTDATCAAIKDVFEDTRAVLEPAGALAIAGAKAYVERAGIEGEDLVAVAREAVLAVTIPEKPGSFRAFCSLVGARNITEFNYRYADPGMAHVFVGVQVRDRAETEALVASLRRHGLETLDFTDNELAKLHVRHLVGGHVPGSIDDEILYRFEFPERPGALMRFLNAMSRGWNISLFHYRNHGADYGRVLVGMQVPAADKKKFEAFLEDLGYPYRDESRNPAYRLFLG
jgi:threonine dehydratase